MDQKPTISVIGAGAWGTALAQTLSSDGTEVTLWTRFEDHAREINAAHENKRYLEGFPLHQNINATHVLENALKSEIILLVTPTQALRPVLKQMHEHIREEHKLILCCKGVEQGSGKLTTEILADILPDKIPAILSGPNFASDIAAHKPAATTLACQDDEMALYLQKSINRPNFRPYITRDIIGVQIAGALKNVVAIACGISHGLEMGDSTNAALITRGLAEIARLGVAMGANIETFLGLAGVGDLTLTCSSHTSRNFSLGYELGQMHSFHDIMKKRKTVAEGVFTSESANLLANKYSVEMPISQAIYNCLYEEADLRVIIQELLNRPLGQEM